MKTKKSFLKTQIASGAENCATAMTVVKNVIASEAKPAYRTGRQSICLFLTTLFISILNSQFSIANSNNDSLTLANYQHAYYHLNNMLSEKETLSFEDAIFTIENAYYDNQLSKTEFTNNLNFHIQRILQLANANKQTLSQNMPKAVNPLTPSPSEMEGERLLLNWAIYTYMTDTTYWKENVSLSPSTSLRTSLVEAYKTNYPMTYQKGDPYGSSNWENTQITTLLDPTKKTGNCFSLAVLYKIFSDRLKSEAYLTTAPQHIYIQHKGLDGDFYNVELTTHTFPGSGTIKAYTYTTHDAVTNGIALRRINEKQEIALCLVYLAKGLEKKLRVKNLSSQRHDEELRMGEFALACAETALKYDPLNLNAMLLKAEALEEQLRVKNLSSQRHDEELRMNNNCKNYQLLESTLFNLYDLGYRQMPTDMQQTLLMMAQGTTPFSQGGRAGDEGLFAVDTSLQYFTLSENLFPELESSENIIAIGNTSINIQSQKIASINTNENLVSADPVTFALTIDPLAAKYPSMSPYNAMGNDPINKIDPDGKAPEQSAAGNSHTVGGGHVKVGRDEFRVDWTEPNSNSRGGIHVNQKGTDSHWWFESYEEFSENSDIPKAVRRNSAIQDRVKKGLNLLSNMRRFVPGVGAIVTVASALQSENASASETTARMVAGEVPAVGIFSVEDVYDAALAGVGVVVNTTIQSIEVEGALKADPLQSVNAPMFEPGTTINTIGVDPITGLPQSYETAEDAIQSIGDRRFYAPASAASSFPAPPTPTNVGAIDGIDYNNPLGEYNID